MKCQILFSGENKKKSKCHLLKNYPECYAFNNMLVNIEDPDQPSGVQSARDLQYFCTWCKLHFLMIWFKISCLSCYFPFFS